MHGLCTRICVCMCVCAISKIILFAVAAAAAANSTAYKQFSQKKQLSENCIYTNGAHASVCVCIYMFSYAATSALHRCSESDSVVFSEASVQLALCHFATELGESVQSTFLSKTKKLTDRNRGEAEKDRRRSRRKSS